MYDKQNPLEKTPYILPSVITLGTNKNAFTSLVGTLKFIYTISDGYLLSNRVTIFFIKLKETIPWDTG